MNSMLYPRGGAGGKTYLSEFALCHKRHERKHEYDNNGSTAQMRGILSFMSTRHVGF